jgi:hypothetical protein
MSLASIDGILFAIYVLETFENNIPSIDARDMKIPIFDAHRYGESNKPKFVLLRPIETETS